MATTKEFNDLKRLLDNHESYIRRIRDEVKVLRDMNSNLVEYLQGRTRSKKSKKMLDLINSKMWIY